MKKTISFIVCTTLAFAISFAQTSTMCVDASSTSTTGTLYDSGGSLGSYGNNENCGFLINPCGATSITLSFASIDIESCCDDINIYDGVDNTGTLLLNAQGTTLPSPVIATSGKMYIEFTSDGSVTPAGFEVNWAATIGTQSPVAANFTPSNSTPAYQEVVSFTDNSTSTPDTWFWDFGDGNTSALQNPTHQFSAIGNNTITLIASNCTFSDTTTQILNVQAHPTIAINPEPFVVNLACGDSTTENFTIKNNGVSNLVVNNAIISGNGLSDSSTVQYTSTGETTNHSFNITNTGIDTLWVLVAVNGDYDSGIGSNEYITDVNVEGISLGTAGTQGLSLGQWDSTLFFLTGVNLTTVLADGMLNISLVNGSGVNTGVGGLELNTVKIYTNGENLLSSIATIPSGDSLVVPVTFYSFALEAGTYYHQISLSTNDVLTPTYIIPVELNLIGTASYVLDDTSCIDFGSILQNDNAYDTIEFTNTGCADLYITDTNFTSSAFSVTYLDDTIGVGQTGIAIVNFNPQSLGNFNGTASFITNVADTSICVMGMATLPQVILDAQPNPFVVNLNCGDSITENFTIFSNGPNTLDITGSIIGDNGISDSSTVQYTSTGETTNHSFNITNNIDTLWILVAVNGDYDSGIGANEIISDVNVEGISLGTAGTQGLTLGQWDSTLLYLVEPDLSTVLADGVLDVSIVNGSGVNTGIGGLDLNTVKIYTNGDNWLSGSVNTTSVLSGDSITVPVTFYSFGLTAGVYNSTISINSNDPVNPIYSLPVILNLNGTADYILSDSCIDFGGNLPGSSTFDTIQITNTGCASLSISSIVTTDPSYSIIQFDNSVGVGQTGQIVVEFSPLSIGVINADIIVTTNVQDTTICLTGESTNLFANFSN